MGELSQLPNIGKVVEEQLNIAEIYSLQDLLQVGSKAAWLRIQAFDPSACYNRLCGLEGAIQGVPKKMLSPEKKAELKIFYNLNKAYGQNKA